ncbi:MAG TPA: SPFH domain-containing protein [Candidatus Acidoferrales bacterium]|nr:SPFH domain-containing protein [Candidatus Acidoferrales bacterium]
MLRENEVRATPGVPVAMAILLAVAGDVFWAVQSIRFAHAGAVVGAVLTLAVLFVLLVGFFVVDPNVGAVVMLFGRYLGTERRPGLWWTHPFATRRPVSLRVRNFESGKLKVNDHDGNPIEIAAVVVWRVVDTAEAIFQVDNYDNFVHVQSESALRNLATSHPYDAHEDGQLSLRGNTADVAENLKKEIQARLDKAGVEVIESRISHLAYAPEIANAMLRRQQANAVIAARTRIVEGAVSMVEMALAELSKREVVNLDEERKAAMVSNLLVVLCSEHETQPIVNAGTLYQ